MSKSIPEGLTSRHVVLALADLDAGISHPFWSPTGYELVHDGKRYAPKAVIGLAFKCLTGQMLGPEDFSGGEAPGQANSVLRDLGFEIVKKECDFAREGFVTSRGYALPTDVEQMSEMLWFNMWQRRLWPYQELQEGDTLYWYDTTQRAIVWKSRVRKIERFEFANKEEVEKRLISVFDLSELKDPYFDAATDNGCCLAYKVDSLLPLNIRKPVDYKFPQGGWLRCSAAEAHEWLIKLPASSSPDGPAADALTRTANQVAKAGYFALASLKDERRKTLREIVERRGQPDFRTKLITAYGGRCAVTSCDVIAALEASHIIPYCGPQSNHVANGLLLRADIHTLFDLNLIGIDPETLTITLATAVKATAYSELQDRSLTLPANAADAPSQLALIERWKQFVKCDWAIE